MDEDSFVHAFIHPSAQCLLPASEAPFSIIGAVTDVSTGLRRIWRKIYSRGGRVVRVRGELSRKVSEFL